MGMRIKIDLMSWKWSKIMAKRRKRMMMHRPSLGCVRHGGQFAKDVCTVVRFYRFFTCYSLSLLFHSSYEIEYIYFYQNPILKMPSVFGWWLSREPIRKRCLPSLGGGCHGGQFAKDAYTVVRFYLFFTCYFLSLLFDSSYVIEYIYIYAFIKIQY